MFAAIHLFPIILFFHCLLKDAGSAGTLLHMAMMVFCAGLMMPGLQIRKEMQDTNSGRLVIASWFIPAVTVVSVLKNCAKGFLILKRSGSFVRKQRDQKTN